MNLQETMNAAVQLHRTGQLAQAESLYRQVLAHNPNHANGLQMLDVFLEIVDQKRQ